jgi:hypothetical protein
MPKKSQNKGTLSVMLARCGLIILIFAVAFAALSLTGCPDDNSGNNNNNNNNNGGDTPPPPPPPSTVATPTASPGQGSFVIGSTLSVTLSTTTTGAEIWYTVNGPNPQNNAFSGSTIWTGTPISITIPPEANVVIRAIAFSGGNQSAMLTATYSPTTGQLPVVPPYNATYSLWLDPTAAIVRQNSATGTIIETSFLRDRGLTWYGGTGVGGDPTNTLLLQGLNFTTSAHIGLIIPDGSRIILDRINTIIVNNTGANSFSMGIVCIEDDDLVDKQTGDLDFFGVGQLTVRAGPGTSLVDGIEGSYGIKAGNTNITGSTIIALAGIANFGNSVGINVVGMLGIEGATVTARSQAATGLNRNSYGILTADALQIKGSTVTATAGNATGLAGSGNSIGIFVNHDSADLTINNSTVAATSGTVSGTPLDVDTRASMGIRLGNSTEGGEIIFETAASARPGRVTAIGHTRAIFNGATTGTGNYIVPNLVRYWATSFIEDLGGTVTTSSADPVNNLIAGTTRFLRMEILPE